MLELAPYMLSLSPIDCEAIDLLFGFDFTYRGNHNQLVAEALGLSPAWSGCSTCRGATIVNYEPSITLALDEDCRMQCRLSIENAHQRLPGPHGRVSRGATERLRHGPALRRPAAGHDLRAGARKPDQRLPRHGRQLRRRQRAAAAGAGHCGQVAARSTAGSISAMSASSHSLVDLPPGGQHVLHDRLHAVLVGERREHVRLERHDRLAEVGLPVAVRQRDHHALARQRFGVHALEDAAVVFVVGQQLLRDNAGSLRSRSLTLNVSTPSG